MPDFEIESSQPSVPAVPWAALIVMVAAACMDLLDGTIVQVALPSMQRELGATDADLQWFSAAYTLAFALVLITGARLGDIFGGRRMFLLGLGAFTLASLATALSVSPPMLIAFRAAQGTASALMLPQILTFIQLRFTEAAKPKAFAVYGMMMAVASASGPLVGGLLVKADIAGLQWRPIFLVNVPIGVTALVAGLHLIPRSPTTAHRRLDLPGLAVLSVALLAVFYPLIQGRYLGWPTWSLAMLAAAVPMIGVFLAWQVHQTRRRRTPLVDLSLFTHRSSGIGLLIALPLFGSTSYFFVLTLHLQQFLGYSALDAGIAFLPFSLGTVVGSVFATPLGRLLGRWAVSLSAILMLGSQVGIVHVLASATAPQIGWALAVPQLGCGTAFGIATGTLATIALSDVPPPLAAAASGVFNTTSQIGSVAAVAIAGAIYFSTLGAHGQPTVAASTAGASQAIWYLVATSAAALVLTLALPLDRHTTQIADIPDRPPGVA